MLFFARHLSTLDWATFSFAASMLLLAQGMQLSIVILPMISFSKGQLTEAVDQAHWTWMNRTVLTSTLLISLLAGALVYSVSADWMATSCLYAALLMPPAFTYEFLRRRLILSRQFDLLTRTGLAYAAGMAFSVSGNYVFDGPPLWAALSGWPGMALAILISGVREPLRWKAPAQHWLAPLKAFAPPAVGSSLAFAGYNFAVQILLGRIAGAPAVAAFNATRMLIQPINTLIGAFNNLDLPNAAKAFVVGGRALVKFQTRAILRLALVGGAYLAVLSLLAVPVLTLLFGGRYSDPLLLWSWVVVGSLMLVVTPTENVFYVTRRPQFLFFSRLAAAAAGCLCAAVAIPTLGSVGAVLSIAVGWMVALVGGVIALWRVRTKDTSTEDA